MNESVSEYKELFITDIFNKFDFLMELHGIFCKEMGSKANKTQL